MIAAEGLKTPDVSIVSPIGKCVDLQARFMQDWGNSVIDTTTQLERWARAWEYREECHALLEETTFFEELREFIRDVRVVGFDLVIHGEVAIGGSDTHATLTPEPRTAQV